MYGQTRSEKDMNVKYYDIGLNLFCRQFPDSEKIIRDAADAGVACILTGTDTKENRQIAAFDNNHDVYGTAGIHPHNADSILTGCFLQRRIRYVVLKNILFWRKN